VEEYAPLLLFLAFAVLKIVQAFDKVNKKIDSIERNCEFDERFTQGIRKDIEILMNEVHKNTHGNKSGLKVLIFDDEVDSTRLLAEKIRTVKPGCEIRTADNLTNAQYHLRMSSIDIVFADLKHNLEEYGIVLKQIMKEQDIKARFVLYSGGEKPEKYDGIFLDKMEIMKNPDILKEYL
jgi:hypothetical protein